MKNNLTNIDLVIFDLDGTLVESNKQEIPYFFEVLSSKVDIDIDKDISQYTHRTFSSVINAINPSTDSDTLYCQLEEAMTSFVQRNSWFPLTSGEKIFRQTLGLGLDYYVVTGNFKKASIEKAELAGIHLPESRVFCTTLDSESKGDVIQHLLSEQKCPPDKVLSIGDSQYDKDIAKQLGMNFLWATL